MATDLLPPISHTCLYQLDLLANEAFFKALESSNRALGQDTDFDWMLHMAVMELGDDTYNA